MNPTVPTCKPTITRIGPWFRLAPIKLEIPKELKLAKFARFDYCLDFAGFSPRGIPLSVKGSAGPAKVGPYPILDKTPPDWVEFPTPTSGILLRTHQPRLAIIRLVDTGLWREEGCDAIAIPRDELSEIIEVPKSLHRRPNATEIQIEELSPAVATLLAQHAKQLKVVFIKGRPHIFIPAGFRFRQDQWELLSRYLISGRGIGCLEETVRKATQSDRLIKIPGTSVAEVMSRYGIGERRPTACDGTNLLFDLVCVNNASKLSRLYPQVKQLEGRTLRLPSKTVHSSMASRPTRTDDDEDECNSSPGGLTTFPLQQSVEAGVIPPDGDLIVDTALEHVFLPTGQIRIADLKCPLGIEQEYPWDPAVLLCPHPLIGTYLLSVAQAARTYRVPFNLKRYLVRTVEPGSQKETDLAGAFYLLSDLTTLPRRDLRLERAERKARHQRLVTRYGSDLPSDYEKHTDEELSFYFQLKEWVARGEVVPAADHPLLPSTYRQRSFVAWLRKAKPDLVVTCPITRKDYVRLLAGMEELAALPGFWKAVEETLGEVTWLRQLMLNQAVRAAALADAI